MLASRVQKSGDCVQKSRDKTGLQKIVFGNVVWGGYRQPCYIIAHRNG